MWKGGELDALIDAINASGYGLTLGVHTRIDSVAAHVAARAQVGNIYVNRNQIGAIVGSQPFGGRGLSGRSEEHTSELQSLMRISYAVLCLKKNTSFGHHILHTPAHYNTIPQNTTPPHHTN